MVLISIPLQHSSFTCSAFIIENVIEYIVLSILSRVRVLRGRREIEEHRLFKTCTLLGHKKQKQSCIFYYISKT